MIELKIELENISPLDLYGTGDKNLELLKRSFPGLKIIARGDMIKAMGEEVSVENFEKKFRAMMTSVDKFGRLTEDQLLAILEPDGENNHLRSEKDKDVLVYGRHGMAIRPLTPNQKKMVKLSDTNDMLFAIGPAGSGKTYTAVALAVRALKNKEVRKIVLTRPAVEAGENLGFLPGDLRDKLDPYLQPLYDALRDMLPPQKLLSLIEDGTIEIAPLAFMRGRTLDHAFVILDEAQNATESQMKMFLTRMGKSAQFIITGDVTQIDLPRNQSSGLVQAARLLQNVKGIATVLLDAKDVVRHRLVADIIKAYDEK